MLKALCVTKFLKGKSFIKIIPSHPRRLMMKGRPVCEGSSNEFNVSEKKNNKHVSKLPVIVYFHLCI